MAQAVKSRAFGAVLAAALAGLVSASAVSARAFAVTDVEDEKPVYLDLRLMGADLIDDLVYAWTKEPPFKEARSVSLVEVAAPAGLDDRFELMVENRLYEIIRANPGLPVRLTHCSICTQLVVKSTTAGTRFSRGIDQPEVLNGLLQTAPDRLGLALDFEAEGRDLVLRAQIFELKGVQPIVWAKTFSTSMSTRRILREATPLVSLEEARKTQKEMMLGRDPLEVVTRFSVRSFTLKDTALANTTAPLIFIEQSFEGVLLPKRNRRVSVTLGATSIKDQMEGFSVGGQLMQLLGRDQPSLSMPDLYMFGGFNYVRIHGPGALPFGQKELDIDNLLRTKQEPKATVVLFRLGLEAHIKFRYGAMAFLEYAPMLRNSDTLQTDTLVGIPYQDMGLGMVIRW